MKDKNMRKFGPKSADHPSIGTPCPACTVAFKEGDFTTLVTLGPGNDEESRKKRDNGKPYNAVALEIHWECSLKESDE